MNNNNIKIVEYKREHQTRFKEINVQWITRTFSMEEEDHRTLDDPEGYILKGGGKIFIALSGDYPVGTCAYLNFGKDTYEMIKMAVDENYRGLGIGKQLGEVSLRKMQETGAKKIILFSNRKGSAKAIELYRLFGFKEVPLVNSEFARADIQMELEF